MLLPPITLPIIPPTGLYAFHNLGHFHPVLGKGIFGGGAYNPQAEAGRYNLQFFTVQQHRCDDGYSARQLSSRTLVSKTDLDSGAEVKACFTWDPRRSESLAFTDRLTILAVNPDQPLGQPWRTIGSIPGSVGKVDWVCR